MSNYTVTRLLRKIIEMEKRAESPLEQVKWVRHFLHLRRLAGLD